ncbi:MAG: hypothetical protein HYR56_29610 [Acidobacteria bacterium]|nr:hypothetical protein [Acidobacteriota bacterium]MBI3421465.1 hypothetical protein [Acidobacteriota bacterium]
MPGFREVLASLVLFASGWIAITPYLVFLTRAYKAYKGNPDTSGYAFLPEIIMPLIVLGISYPLYAKFPWARSCALIIVLIDLSFVTLAFVWTWLTQRFDKQRT